MKSEPALAPSKKVPTIKKSDINARGQDVPILKIRIPSPGYFQTCANLASELVQRGVYLHPWHNNFICAALTEGDVEKTLAVAHEAFAEVRKREGTLEPHARVAAMLRH